MRIFSPARPTWGRGGTGETRSKARGEVLGVVAAQARNLAAMGRVQEVAGHSKASSVHHSELGWRQVGLTRG